MYKAMRHFRLFSAIICGFLLAAGPMSLGAQTVTIDPDPGIPGEVFVDYSGHYGEVFKLRGGWKIKGVVQGKSEVIRQYPPFRIDIPDSVDSFNPAPSDFVPENFTHYALIQLIIQPRSGASSQTLEELKNLKNRELQSAGVDFKIIDHPFFGGIDGDWPTGTFEILIDAPYRLTQLYAATPSYLCILTGGRDTPPSTAISAHYEWVRSSLRDWVVSAPQLDRQRSSTTAPALNGLAAEVLAHLKETKEYMELGSIYDSNSMADPNWSESEQGQAVAAKIKIMLDDAASTRIVKTDKGMALQYSVGGQTITDTGIIAADLKADKDYRDFIARAVSTNISSDGKIQVFLSRLRGQRIPRAEISSPLAQSSEDTVTRAAYARSERRLNVAIDSNRRATALAERLAAELEVSGAAHEPGN